MAWFKATLPEAHAVSILTIGIFREGRRDEIIELKWSCLFNGPPRKFETNMAIDFSNLEITILNYLQHRFICPILAWFLKERQTWSSKHH